MENPTQPNANAQPADQEIPNPTQQTPANAKQDPAPVAAPARAAAVDPSSAIIARVVGQRDALRTENKILQNRFDSLEKKIDMLINQGTFGSEESRAALSKINADRDQVVGDLQKGLNDQDLIDQAVEASSGAINRAQRILSSVSIDLNNLADPDVKALQELHDNIYYSGNTDYSDLYVLASETANKRLAAKQVDPTKIREEGRSEALEGIKKLGSVKTDIPGGPTAQALVNDQAARRRAALDAARAQT